MSLPELSQEGRALLSWALQPHLSLPGPPFIFPTDAVAKWALKVTSDPRSIDLAGR